MRYQMAANAVAMQSIMAEFPDFDLAKAGRKQREWFDREMKERAAPVLYDLQVRKMPAFYAAQGIESEFPNPMPRDVFGLTLPTTPESPSCSGS